MTDYGLSEATEKLSKAFTKFSEELREVIAPTVEALINISNQYSKICIESADPKLKHLALHSKKARVRKKNINRIIKQLNKI